MKTVPFSMQTACVEVIHINHCHYWPV